MCASSAIWLVIARRGDTKRAETCRPSNRRARSPAPAHRAAPAADDAGFTRAADDADGADLTRAADDADSSPGAPDAPGAPGAPDAPDAPVMIVIPPALLASGVGAMSRQAVSLPSMTRSTRSHVLGGICRSAVSGTSARSSATAVHTPDCSTRFNALSARSMIRSSNVPGPPTARLPGSQAGSTALAVFERACPRTHKSRVRSRPQAAPDAGSKRSNVSMRATGSPRWVAAPNQAHMRLVRPDETGPTTSDSWPRAMPPSSAASSVATWQAMTHSPGGRTGTALVNVRSSLRARSNDSSTVRGVSDARAGAGAS